MLAVYICAGAQRNEIVGMYNHRLKIMIKASAQKQKANQALIVFLAELLTIPIKKIYIKSGQLSAYKIICFNDDEFNQQGCENILNQLLAYAKQGSLL